MTWRDKTLVLCFYEYVGREYGRTVRRLDSVMVEVEFSDQVLPAFEVAMKRRQALWRPNATVGPQPMEWTLLRYQTASGVANF
jgi:hypothetical protein